MRRRRGVLVLCLVLGLLSAPYLPVQALDDREPAQVHILSVGSSDQMKTRNILPAIALTAPCTMAVLGRVYDTVGQADPVTNALLPNIVRGVDADGDGVFQQVEDGAFLKSTCPAPCPDPIAWRRNITAYYDSNGVRFHDGVQATIGDVMFNYVLQSLNPMLNTHLRVLWDDPGSPSFPANRHVNIVWMGGGVSLAWEGTGRVPGAPNLRCGLRFTLKDDYALFYRSTLVGLPLLPRHVYEGTGGGRHADWGYAVYPESWLDPRLRLQGVPTGETAIAPFNYVAAGAWQLTDADVIGSGHFRFVTWQFGQFARLDANPDYVLGPPQGGGNLFTSY